jgi:adenylate cyclase
LTTAIARVPNSFVIARNTAFAYRGKTVDLKAIGKDLGVRYVLEGSVQPSGNQVRVNAQLIDADSGAHLWAEQFDTPRADLLQMQDEIVTHLARSLELQLTEAETARLKGVPATNPNAEDLALQCEGALRKVGYFGKEADAGYRLCEQALAVDPDNVHALSFLSIKFWLPIFLGVSADPKADLKRADELASRALTVNPNYENGHGAKHKILGLQGRLDDAIAEGERALALDPSDADTYAGLSYNYLNLGQFEKSLEYFDKTIRLSPLDSALVIWYDGKASAFFGLKQYDQAIDWARRSMAINPNYPFGHLHVIAAFALSGHEAEARDALQRYLELPSSGIRTITAFKAYNAQFTNERSNPRYLELLDRLNEALRKAGMPET